MAHAKNTKLSLVRRAFRALLRTGITLAIVAVAAVLVQLGSATLERRAEAVPAPEAAPLIPVTAAAPEFVTEFEVARRFVGQIEAARTTEMSFELSGQLEEITVDEGDDVLEGQVVARMDQTLLYASKRRLEASRDATEAQLRFADQTVERNNALTERGFTSQAGLDEARARQDELRARIAEIEADLETVNIRLEKSLIVAPFSGRITERFVDGGETLSAGQPVAGLVETAAPALRVGVPLDITETQLENGVLDVNGESFPAQLRTLRPDIDPVTRTRTAVFDLPLHAAYAFGQTAALELQQQVDAKGFWLPITNLKEGQNGQWSVLAVDPEQLIRDAPVEILHVESTRVFVRAALPKGTKIVAAGPQRLTVGQRVAVSALPE